MTRSLLSRKVLLHSNLRSSRLSIQKHSLRSDSRIPCISTFGVKYIGLRNIGTNPTYFVFCRCYLSKAHYIVIIHSCSLKEKRIDHIGSLLFRRVILLDRDKLNRRLGWSWWLEDSRKQTVWIRVGLSKQTHGEVHHNMKFAVGW